MSSVAALTSPASIYREEQNFARWIYAFLAVIVLACGLGLFLIRDAESGLPPSADGWHLNLAWLLVAGLFLPPAAVVVALHMTTEVTPTECAVWYGWVPTYRRAIALEQIRRVEIVTYHAFRDHGFWGSRVTRDGERVFTARGDRAVRLHLVDGSRILIGTQRPEELAGVLDRERRPVG